MKIVYAVLRGREIYNACRNDYLHEISSRFRERWWCEECDELRGLVLKWFTELYEHNTGGHYSKLRESVLEHGFMNPIIVTSGAPLRREPWMVAPNDCQYICEQNGGSRLALAQELDLELPCIVNGDAPGEELHSLNQVKAKFADKSYRVWIDAKAGVMSNPQNLMHLGRFSIAQNSDAVGNSKAEVIRRAEKWLSQHA